MSSSVLVVERIAKQFGDLQAVRDLSFEIYSGEIFGFLGPNGAGKTTTLRMLMGITAPDAGVVRYEDRLELDRGRVGYLPEERGLFEDMPVLDNLGYLGVLRGMSALAARSAAQALLERFGLADRAHENVGALSKGNQQKVQFAGAVLHRPKLAVLDEPFSGLDPINQDLFGTLMRELRDQGTAVLLSAHQLDLVERLADRFLLISRGRQVLAGTLEQMRQQAAGGRDEILRLQLAPRDGGVDAMAAAHAIAARAGGARVETHAAADHTAWLEVLLPPGADLSPLVAAAATYGIVKRLETRRLPLQEIYLRAVREGGGTVSEEEVTARA